MKKLLICTLSLLLITGVQACTNKPAVDPNQSSITQSSEQAVKDYLKFIEDYDTAQLGHLSPDVTKPDLIQKDYDLINLYLTRAEQIEGQMNLIAINNKDHATQMQLAAYLPIIKARVAVLKANKGEYLRMGAQ